MEYDFAGYATKNDIRCSDGRIIKQNAFADCDGKIVPLVWNHKHESVNDVLGHALLENRADGVYTYGKFNDTEDGQTAKILVDGGDVKSLSIYANMLKQQGPNVCHGYIREVSLVLAGANPKAFIDTVIKHSDSGDSEEGIIYCALEDEKIVHSEELAEMEDKNAKIDVKESVTERQDNEKNEEDTEMAESTEKTVGDVFDEFTEEQKKVVYAIVGAALESNEEEDDEDMKHNAFDGNENMENNFLSHSDMTEILADGKRYGSLKASAEAHDAGDVICHATDANGNTVSYGIANLDYMFPDARAIANEPVMISRNMDWVQKVIGRTHHTMFSRIKTVFADITEDEARAKGYIKGNLKKDEVFSLLKRTTNPTTIYKKQKMDRDDIVDITDFDVVNFIKGEMRVMLNEEIARAILVGDGRLSSSDDKIDESCIRPIWTDAALYTVKKRIDFAAADTTDAKAKKFIQTVIRSRKDYKGSGNPVLFTTEDRLTDCLLMEDSMGHVIYDTVEKLKTALRVSEIITVPVMENLSRTGVQAIDGDTDTRVLEGILVNLADYNVGADKGGSINMFDGFDIDYNQQKYLMETRCSGALVKPYSAIAFESVQAQANG